MSRRYGLTRIPVGSTRPNGTPNLGEFQTREAVENDLNAESSISNDSDPVVA